MSRVDFKKDAVLTFIHDTMAHPAYPAPWKQQVMHLAKKWARAYRQTELLPDLEAIVF